MRLVHVFLNSILLRIFFFSRTHFRFRLSFVPTFFTNFSSSSSVSLAVGKQRTRGFSYIRKYRASRKTRRSNEKRIARCFSFSEKYITSNSVFMRFYTFRRGGGAKENSTGILTKERKKFLILAISFLFAIHSYMLCSYAIFEEFMWANARGRGRKSSTKCGEI